MDLDLNLWALDGYESILQDRNALIDDRDATHFNTSFYSEEFDNGVVGAIVTN